MCRNNGIGYKGQLPWRILHDLEYFSKLTKGDGNNAVIMGNKTWQSLPIPKGKMRGLQSRDNFVLSRASSFDMLIAHERLLKTFKTIAELESYIETNNIYEDIWVIGGASVYKQFLESGRIRHCYITHIDADFECDTFFPLLDSTEWKEINRDETFDTTYNCNVIYSVYEHLVIDQNKDCR
jgi:dihydrofolate reductase